MARARYNASADRKKVDRLVRELSKIVRVFSEYDPLVRGSFQTLRRRCGKDPCCCVDGKLHETSVFVDRSSGKRRIEKAPSHTRTYSRSLPRSTNR